ncbi:SapC family protein [Roseococcus suduntuyensis]|uniref:SapC protein n=1 Tax=Roseococcus suduntuyensis TaxID=455361 RepID=A0A840AAW1_9PROT|nr:SapC family protein [Roseococcus suduntuyensis]MBB3897676.1 hypothetical protein [Roseococcus suduntuyensis]
MSEAASPLPPLYGGLVPLNQMQHAQWRVRDVGFGFAAGIPAVPLALEEFPLAARHMGVVFATGAPHMPLAILGGGPGRNLFINEAGQWRDGVYVPAYLRRYPFLLARTAPGSEELALCLDPGAPQFSEAEGEPLFDAEGKPTAMASRAFEFTRAVEGSFLRTQEFVAALAELKLLGPAAVQFEQGGRNLRVDGFHAVQREAFNALTGEQLVMLRDKGWLEAIHAHLFSVAALPSIVQQAAA